MDSKRSTSESPRMEVGVLPNGMRVLLLPPPFGGGGDVVYVGIAIRSGTRDELPTESGMAHFTEHMSFKGTTHRRACHIANRMEAVGGDLNAYTAKEETVYYCACLRPDLRRAIDLLLDITLHSTYPQEEMDREADVVVEEIESYNDTPSELIFDDFETLLFGSHPLGRNILGSAERLREYRTDDVMRYAQRQYRPENMVLYIMGDVNWRMGGVFLTRARSVGFITHAPLCVRGLKTHATGARYNRAPHTSQAESLPPQSSPAPTIIRQRDTHQAHVMLGTLAYSGADPRHLPLYLLNNILGGPGMNARLNVSLRERRGLVYTVESALTTYTDAGLWAVYFGCAPADIDRCLTLTHRELARLAAAPLTPRALAAAKRQLIGQVTLSYDNHENVALAAAKRYLLYGTLSSRHDFIRRIEAITAEQVHAVAQELFAPERLTTLIYK